MNISAHIPRLLLNKVVKIQRCSFSFCSMAVKRKAADHDTDCLISGFIREMQQTFPTNVTFYIIPELINCTCMRFYYMPEKFIKCSRNMEIKEDGNYVELKNGDYDYRSVYGKLNIDAKSDCIYNWEFKIGKEAYGYYIGITSAKTMDTEIRFVDTEEDDYYAYSNGGYKYDLPNRDKDGYGTSSGFSNDNHVIMELNVALKVLTFRVIGKDTVTFKNINFDGGKEYRIAISMYYSNASIELLQFSTKYRK